MQPFKLEQQNTPADQNRKATIDPPPALKHLTDQADVRFNGNKPWDIQVHDARVYSSILAEGSLGFGESYMQGLWDCEALDEMSNRLLRINVDEQLGGWAKLLLLGEALRERLFNLQSQRRAFQVGERHYDIGNDLFTAMLDSTMSYSCGFWEHADTLEQAQRHKLELICRKLKLRRGERLLEIGCGWGGLAHYAATHYGVEVVGVTVSKEQQALAQARCRGLPIQIILSDYRDVEGLFDKIVSVGMFEHVGPKNYPVFFDTALRLLRDDGLFLLHTIGNYKTLRNVDPWIAKYVFPNGKLPSAEELAAVLNNRFIVEDWHNFGQDYDHTLMAWWQRFDAEWPQLANVYGETFYRMWRFYLLGCAGYFRSRQGQLWQLVLSKRERAQTYRSVRAVPETISAGG
ncbi:MAG: cyclopropane fatty acyl phospholipid synthase [Burkholderiaceae bacterium]